MDPERWREIESIFQRALDAGESSRGGVLEQFCAGDEELRRDVESLLDQHDKAGDFLEIPAFGGLPPAASGLENMVVGHFRIMDKIGSGGMGVVYRAEDLNLQRYAALKFLPEEVANDRQWLQRFRREARAASILNHPGICTIYEIDEAQGRLFIAMELLEGQTLREMISGKPLPAAVVLAMGLQIVAALDCAHSAGIVHRDIKPANVFVTRQQRVKVLDFGLAKRALRRPNSEVAELPLSDRTEPGMVMGTVGYIAPEQIRGQAGDHRSDIFAFGVVLYEMLTGKRAFEKPTSPETMAAILNEEPPPLPQLAPNTPSGLIRVVKRCLDKNPDQRFQSASDLAFALETVAESGSSTMVLAGGHSRWFLRGKASRYGALGALALAALAVAVWLSPSITGPFESTQITYSTEPKEGPLFTDGSRLYLQSGGVPSEMASSGGIIAPLHILESGMKLVDISADGAKVLAIKLDPHDTTDRGTLWIASILGGPARKLSDHMAFAARWSPDAASVVFADLKTLYTVNADGANLRKIWDAPGYVSDPSFSPDAQGLTATVVNPSERFSRLWNLGASGQNPHLLQLNWPWGVNQYAGQWTPDGKHFLYLSTREGRGNVYEMIPPRWFAFWKKHSAVRVTGNQVDIQALTPARDGKRLFVLGQLEQGAMRMMDPHTSRFVPFLYGLPALQFSISPDRQWMAYTEFPTRFLWKSRLDGSERLQLTNSPAMMEQWSRDSRSLVYSDIHKLYLVSAEGGAPEKLIPGNEGDEIAPTWSPDAKSIAFSHLPYPDDPLTGIHVIDLASRRVSVMPGSVGYFYPSWSPDGKFLIAMAASPSRMVLYSADTGTWKDLRLFDTAWGYWAWANDSKSIYMAMKETKNDGMYRLTVPQGTWTRLSGFEGANIPGGSDLFPSVTADGLPALMSRTSVAQIYSLTWKR
jgi:eukaryotic-like serine/threonine-protein kinase